MFDLAFAETTSAWDLDSDGSWHRHDVDDRGHPLEDMQAHLISTVSSRGGSR